MSASYDIRLLANQLFAILILRHSIQHGVVALILLVNCHIVHHKRLILHLRGSVAHCLLILSSVNTVTSLTQPRSGVGWPVSHGR